MVFELHECRAWPVGIRKKVGRAPGGGEQGRACSPICMVDAPTRARRTGQSADALLPTRLLLRDIRPCAMEEVKMAMEEGVSR